MSSSLVKDERKIGFFAISLEGLSYKQCTELQEVIFDFVIENARKDGVCPSFSYCKESVGGLIVCCSNQETSDWLKKNTSFIQAQISFDIKCLDEADFPTKHTVVARFPPKPEYITSKLLNAIQAQNELSTSEWKVTSREKVFIFPGEVLELLIVVDDESMNKLKALKGRICFRFETLQLQLFSQKPEQQRQEWQFSTKTES